MTNIKDIQTTGLYVR